MKAFKVRAEAEEFSKNGKLSVNINVEGLKSPSSLPIPAEKSLHRSLSPQELVAFRKEIEQNNLSIVYQMIMENPRYLVSVANTPTILKVGPRYNALHVAVLSKNVNMCKLILHTIELPAFIQLLHLPGQTEQNVIETSLILLESYLNMPDKSRRETPLHFAAQYGLKDIVALLISYNLCKATINKDGFLPKDVICKRCDGASEALKQEIAVLLEDRFFVPVYRSLDESEPAVVGEPFTGNTLSIKENEHKSEKGLTPEKKIAAIAGPMDKEHAKVFQKRWKTPPRIQVRSPSQSTPISFVSPVKPVTKSCVNNNYSSTPIAFHPVRKLFTDNDMNEDHNGNEPVNKKVKTASCDIPSSSNTCTQNGSNQLNHNFTEYREHNTDVSLLDSPVDYKEARALYDSPAITERLVRATDPYKGIERVGRDLAKQHKVGWREYWKFLDTMVDLTSPEGLSLMELYLQKKESHTAEPKLPTSPANDSISAICASLNTLHLNQEPTTPRSKPLDAFKHLYGSSPDREPIRSPLNNNIITNPTLSIEKALQVYAKRACSHIARNLTTINDAIAYELKKLNSVVISFVGDYRFLDVDFKKTHSRYATLIKWYITSQEHPNGINKQEMMQAVKQLNDQKVIPNLNAEVLCIVKYLNASNSLSSNPELISIEADCIQAWASEKACDCSYVMPIEHGHVKARRKIRQFRLNLMHSYLTNGAGDAVEDSQKKITNENPWKARNAVMDHDSDDEFEAIISSDDEEFYVSYKTYSNYLTGILGTFSEHCLAFSGRSPNIPSRIVSERLKKAPGYFQGDSVKKLQRDLR